MKSHYFRLHRGDDLNMGLRQYVMEQQIGAATIASCVGCISKATIRDASGVLVHCLQEPMEIVSVMGTISMHRTHLHISLSREDLSTIGGHLMEGCIVNTTAEIVLIEYEDMEFLREYDEMTGYDEIVFKKLGIEN